eukprot:gene13447-9258_t
MADSTGSSPTAGAPPTIITPGPDLIDKIRQFAAKLSKRDKQQAEKILAKVFLSAHRDHYLYATPSHVFYPFFLQELTNFRENPAAREAFEQRMQGSKSTPQPEGSAGAKSSSATTTTTTTTRTLDGMVRMEGGTVAPVGSAEAAAQEAQLAEIEAAARRYQQDPHPSQYSCNFHDGTLEVHPLTMELIVLTAQYVSKYGEAFVHELLEKQQRTNNASLQFLLESDPRHELFQGLVRSYRLILDAKDDETEERLVDRYSSVNYLKTMVEEKMKFAKASLARRQEALLTDETLKQKLQWTYFEVLKTFRLSDLLLDGPVPSTARSVRAAATPATDTSHLSNSTAAAERAEGEEKEKEKEEGATKRLRVEEVDGAEEDPSAAPSSARGRPPPPLPPPTYQPTFMSKNLVRPGKKENNHQQQHTTTTTHHEPLRSFARAPLPSSAVGVAPPSPFDLRVLCETPNDVAAEPTFPFFLLFLMLQLGIGGGTNNNNNNNNNDKAKENTSSKQHAQVCVCSVFFNYFIFYFLFSPFEETSAIQTRSKV